MRTGEDRSYQGQQQSSARASVERWPRTSRAGSADRGWAIAEGGESGQGKRSHRASDHVELARHLLVRLGRDTSRP